MKIFRESSPLSIVHVMLVVAPKTRGRSQVHWGVFSADNFVELKDYDGLCYGDLSTVLDIVGDMVVIRWNL